jgi:hypothetical protein
VKPRQSVPIAWWILRAGVPGHPLIGVLAVWKLWERYQLAKYRVKPVRRDGLLRYCVMTYRGERVKLQDGTVVDRGARIIEIHLNNDRMRASAGKSLPRRLVIMRQDVDALRTQITSGAIDTPVAFHGESLFMPSPRLFGIEYETRPLTRNWKTAFKRFFFAGLVMLYDRRGWPAVTRNAQRWPYELWLSRTGFLNPTR